MSSPSGFKKILHAFSRNGNRPETEEEDCESGLTSAQNAGGKEPEPRFDYEPKGFLRRLVVGLGAKTKLEESKIVKVPYKWWWRWVLVALLVLITIFLTPQLLPKWLGFKWATSSDLCTNRDKKLRRLRMKMDQMANITEGKQFVSKAENALKCMNDTALSFWNGKTRVKYPPECISANAKASTKQFQVCVEPVCAEACVNFIFNRLVCKTKCTPRRCRNVAAADPASERKIAEINAMRNSNIREANTTGVKTKTSEIKSTANKAAEKIVNRLLTQVDIASNLYIAYVAISILVGTPLLIYKREKKSRFIGATLGLRKSTFILIVVVCLTLWDSGVQIIRSANLPLLLKNFRNDPCYLDPEFSRARLTLIQETCGNVTKQRATLDQTVAAMTRVYYDTSLCEVCKVGDRGQDTNPKLVVNVDSERKSYSKGSEKGYIYPASCNSTALNIATSVAPDSNISPFKAFLSSGIFAQILLKAILSTWLLHLVGFIEPMTTHRGQVEIFGIPPDDHSEEDAIQTEMKKGKKRQPEIHLTKREILSAKRFARDKHLVPLIVFSFLMLWEIVIIIYSAVQSNNGSNILANVTLEPGPAVSAIRSRCSHGKLMPL